MYSNIINTLNKNKLLRTVNDRETSQGRVIKINGRDYINFSSNDYLGFASNKNILNAAKVAIDEYGFGAGASRLLSGGIKLHNLLEKEITLLKGSESALLFNSGYTANIGAIAALTSQEDSIFSDELNHASIIDGCRLSRAKKYIYKHNNPAHLEKLLKSVTSRVKLIITESIFSMDGDIAKLDEINNICIKHKSLFYIDDAHATGVIGKGKGSLEHFGIKANNQIVQMGTFSKALGSFGGFITASNNIVEYLVNSSRSLIYSTALPAPVIAASLSALSHLKKHPELINKLKNNISLCRKYLKESGFYVDKYDTPIIPILFNSVEDTLKASDYLLENGIFAPAIRPPTVKKPRIRISISADHSEEDIFLLISTIKEALSSLSLTPATVSHSNE